MASGRPLMRFIQLIDASRYSIFARSGPGSVAAIVSRSSPMARARVAGIEAVLGGVEAPASQLADVVGRRRHLAGELGEVGRGVGGSSHAGVPGRLVEGRRDIGVGPSAARARCRARSSGSLVRVASRTWSARRSLAGAFT